MQIINTKFPEVKMIKPTVFNDHRGFFLETFNQEKLEVHLGRKIHFVQENLSYSKKNVLRGLHYQLPPTAQAKLVQVIQGEILDVIVDIRQTSENFGRWISMRLTAEDKAQVWIPEGFAHGFLVLSNTAEILYKCTSHWNAKLERCILWNDCVLDIDWENVTEPTLSEKDKRGILFADIEAY